MSASKEETERLLSSSRPSQVQEDARLARALAEVEASEARQREANANARAWDAYHSRPYYYYGTVSLPLDLLYLYEFLCSHGKRNTHTHTHSHLHTNFYENNSRLTSYSFPPNFFHSSLYISSIPNKCLTAQWRAPYPRPVVVYREDPCTQLWVLWCFFVWLIIFFVTIILLVIYL